MENILKELHNTFNIKKGSFEVSTGNITGNIYIKIVFANSIYLIDIEPAKTYIRHKGTSKGSFYTKYSVFSETNENIVSDIEKLYKHGLIFY